MRIKILQLLERSVTALETSAWMIDEADGEKDDGGDAIRILQVRQYVIRHSIRNVKGVDGMVSSAMVVLGRCWSAVGRQWLSRSTSVESNQHLWVQRCHPSDVEPWYGSSRMIENSHTDEGLLHVGSDTYLRRVRTRSILNRPHFNRC